MLPVAHREAKTGEGFYPQRETALRSETPHPALRATFSHKGRRDITAVAATSNECFNRDDPLNGNSNMHVKGKVCVVTGAASGIGAAVARAYAEAGARGVVVADLKTSRDRLAAVAGDIDGLAVTADVGIEEDVKALIAAAEDKYGPVDVFFSNAGLSRKGQESASDADWDVSWRVHVMSHVFAARALVPGMLARGSGYLLNTASAAGLLASLNSMPYGVTKNAAIALAEHLAIQYGDRGIRVSVLCPQSVQTGMTTPGPSAARVDGVLQPPEVARMVIEAMEAERFLILSHQQVAEYMQRKASSRERWLSGMRRLRDKIYGAPQSA
jgi:NAD(P)-dependent dehydrogenase (short-subunit alcohol dehydrogenase family)